MIDVKNLPDGRVVVHYLNFLTRDEIGNSDVRDGYGRAVARAKRIGGKRYRAKWYGGGIVFEGCNLKELEQSIKDIVAKESGD